MPKKEKLPKQKKPPKQAKHVKQQKKRKGRSVQDFIGVKTFTKYGLMTQKGELLFYLVSPTNISVLSYVNIEIKIRHLMMVLSSIPDIEITCTDSSECFDDNKAYLHDRLEYEQNPKVRKLIKKDIEFLDNVQVEMATARQFLFTARIKASKDKQVFDTANRVEKIISEQGFEVRRMRKADIKRFLALYFEASMNGEQMPDIRNAMKRVRKKDSSIILASQNIEDFLIPSIREFTKPLFSIPTHQFLFNAGQINPKEYMDALQVEPSEFELIKYPERGTCLFRCGNERYLLQVIAPDYKAALFGKAGGR